MHSTTSFSPKIIGTGKPGCKTRDLIKYAELVESINVQQDGKTLILKMPKSAAITPELCRNFEKKADCKESDTSITAKEKMMNTSSGEFDDALGELYRFHYEPYFCGNCAIRSDDLGATGVLSSSFVQVNTNNTDAHNITNIRKAAINVLSSAYSEDAKTMAHLFAKWGSEGTGILMNPFYGRKYQTRRDGYVKGPAYSLAYLAPLAKSDYSVWQVSRGIAAKSDEIIGITRSTDQDIALSDLMRMMQHYQCIGLKTGSWLPELAFFESDFQTAIEPDRIRRISQMLDSGMKQIRKDTALYVEMVCEKLDQLEEWVILQISGIDWSSFARPKNTNFDEKWLQTKRVMGFADKEINGVHFVKTPGEETRKYNAEHKNRLLVIEVGKVDEFQKWRISDYGNAGTIAFVADEIEHPVVSHVGGLLRMLNIPLLVFQKGKSNKEIEKLRTLDEDAKLRIVVDETIPVGGILKN